MNGSEPILKRLSSMIFLFIFIGISAACTPKAEPEPDESMFRVGIDHLTAVQVNEPFVIRGYLDNISKYPWEILHGAGIFTYKIFDEAGNAVPREDIPEFLFRNDIGYLRTLKPNESYRNNGEEQRSKEFYEFRIPTPGRYKVQVQAEFRITREQDAVDFVIIADELHEFMVE